MENEMETAGIVEVHGVRGLGLACWLLVGSEGREQKTETTILLEVLGATYRGICFTAATIPASRAKDTPCSTSEGTKGFLIWAC